MSDAFVGVLRFEVLVPGARATRGARRPVRSLMDKLSARGSVVIREVGAAERPARFTLLATTCGGCRTDVRNTLEAGCRKAMSYPDLCIQNVQLDVFGWDAYPRTEPVHDKWGFDE